MFSNGSKIKRKTWKLITYQTDKCEVFTPPNNLRNVSDIKECEVLQESDLSKQCIYYKFQIVLKQTSRWVDPFTKVQKCFWDQNVQDKKSIILLQCKTDESNLLKNRTYWYLLPVKVQMKWETDGR